MVQQGEELSSTFTIVRLQPGWTFHHPIKAVVSPVLGFTAEVVTERRLWLEGVRWLLLLTPAVDQQLWHSVT